MDMREDMRPLAVAVVKVLQNISVSVVNTPLDKQSFALLCGGLCALQIHVPKARSAAIGKRPTGAVTVVPRGSARSPSGKDR